MGKLASGTMSRVTNNIMSFYYAKDPNISIGKLNYKMRMRNPIQEAIKWYREKDKVLRDISPMHNLFSKKIEKEINTYSGAGKNMLITVMISKASGLKVSGPPRKIAPYIYYQFYNFDDHFSDVTYGENPTFSVVDKFNVIYDSTFHDYLENQYLEILVLDNSNALEVQVNQNNKERREVMLKIDLLPMTNDPFCVDITKFSRKRISLRKRL
jgi:hypothetical protein